MNTNEYIERKAVLDLLNDVDRCGYLEGSDIRSIPAASVSPVVFCRNCKHRGTGECPMYHEETVSWQNKELMPEWDVIAHDYTRDDGFCDRGKRR